MFVKIDEYDAPPLMSLAVFYLAAIIYSIILRNSINGAHVTLKIVYIF